MRKFAIAILNGEDWALDLCDEVIKKMPIPVTYKELGFKDVLCPICQSTNTLMFDSTPERTTNACLACGHKWEEGEENKVIKPRFLRCLDCVNYNTDHTCKAKKHYHTHDEKAWASCKDGEVSITKIKDLLAAVDLAMRTRTLGEADQVLFAKMKQYYFIPLEEQENVI